MNMVLRNVVIGLRKFLIAIRVREITIRGWLGAFCFPFVKKIEISYMRKVDIGLREVWIANGMKTIKI